MKKFANQFMLCMLLGTFSIACDSDSDILNDDDDDVIQLASAYTAFDSDNVTVMLDGDEVIIESNGLPNHTSPYWSNTHSFWQQTPEGDSIWYESPNTSNHPLFSEPVVTSFEEMAPGNIDDFNGSYSLTVPAAPEIADNSSSTGLGPIGIAVSGAMIYNDEEGPNVPLDNAAPSLDYNGAHTGPQSYHYHLEPRAWSEDDDELIGVMADGFFLYGRKCTSTGTYPQGLDASGGHISSTKYNDEEEYHYHIENELYLNQYYILFPGNYQGTANAIN